MIVHDYANDIPPTLARQAHEGTSHSPVERGEQEIASYVATMTADFEALDRLVTADTRAWFEQHWIEHRVQMRARTVAVLQARSRILSTLVCGPSSFPAKRMERANNTERKRSEELATYRGRALTTMRKRLVPESAAAPPVMASDSNAVEALEQKLATVERMRSQCKRANAILRAEAKRGEAAQRAALSGALGLVVADEAMKPDELGRPLGYPAHVIAAFASESRRLRQRIEQVKTAKATPDTHVLGELGEVWDLPAENRIRLRLLGAPDRATHQRLKRGGFRYAPSFGDGVWSAYRNSRARAVALSEAAIPQSTAMPAPPPSTREPELIKASILSVAPRSEWVLLSRRESNIPVYSISVVMEPEANLIIGAPFTRDVHAVFNGPRELLDCTMAPGEGDGLDDITQRIALEAVRETIEPWLRKGGTL